MALNGSAAEANFVAALENQLRSYGTIGDVNALLGEASNDELHPTQGGSASPVDDDSRRPAKRGRKRKEDPESLLQDPELDLDQKRKLQNRAAQRQFRERKEARVNQLERRSEQAERQASALKTLCERLWNENQILRGGAGPSSELSGAPSSYRSAPPPLTPVKAEVCDMSPLIVPAVVDSRLFLAPQPLQIPAESTSVRPATTTTAISDSLPAPTVPIAAHGPHEADPTQLNFDFEAPFDFSPSLTLPSQLQEFLDSYTASLEGSPAPISQARKHSATSVVGTPLRTRTKLDSRDTSPDSVVGAGQQDDYGDDSCPGDDPTPLEASQMPCPECDFSVMSCALPLPWRPPPLNGSGRDVWVSQKAWAKLCSHPLFNQCDVNELCTELRDLVRCSDDGRLVIAKVDVCAVFKTIPARAKLREMRGEA